MNCLFCKKYCTQNGKCKGCEDFCDSFEDIDFKPFRYYVKSFKNIMWRA